MLYLLFRSCKNNCCRKEVTDLQEQMSDILVLKEHEAQWLGFLISILYVNIAALVFSQGNQVYEKLTSSYFSRSYYLYITLASTLLKIIAFFPLYYMVDPEKLKDTNPYAKLLAESGVNEEMEEAMLTAEENENDQAALQQRDPNEQRNEHENDVRRKPDRWYMIMIKKMHYKFWPVWILIWIADGVALTLYGISNSTKYEYYTQVFLIWNLCMGIMSSAQFFYCMMKELCCHKMGHPALNAFD